MSFQINIYAVFNNQIAKLAIFIFAFLFCSNSYIITYKLKFPLFITLMP